MPDLTIERLQLFLLVVMPGIIAIKLYDLVYPPEKRDFGSSLLEATAYGLINLAIWVLPLIYINRKSFIEEHAGWYAILSGCFCVISPSLLALGWMWLRKSRFVCSRVGYPNKTAWDDFFKKGQECWILFHQSGW